MMLLSKLSKSVNKALISFVSFYQGTFSFFLGGHCRFQPTCSEYAKQSLETHGCLKGLAHALRRLCRCHPFGGHGYDPVNLSQEKKR